MPETDFFAVPEDEDRLISLVFDLRLEIAPNLRYPSRSICAATNQTAYAKIRTMTSLFFIYSEDLLVSPFQMVQMDHVDRYFIRQRYGGPYVMFLRYLPYEENGIKVLPSSSISYYSTFYNSITGGQFRPSKEFKALYKVFSAEVKRDAFRGVVPCIDGSTRDFWVTPLAKAAVEGGAKFAVEGLTLQP